MRCGICICSIPSVVPNVTCSWQWAPDPHSSNGVVLVIWVSPQITLWLMRSQMATESQDRRKEKDSSSMTLRKQVTGSWQDPVRPTVHKGAESNQLQAWQTVPECSSMGDCQTEISRHWLVYVTVLLSFWSQILKRENWHPFSEVACHMRQTAFSVYSDDLPAHHTQNSNEA